MPTTMQDVKSSQLAAIGYEADTKTMRIRFAPKKSGALGPLYDYANVPAEVHEALLAAPSAGSYFIREIKKRPDLYPFERVTEPVEPEAAEEGVAA